MLGKRYTSKKPCFGSKIIETSAVGSIMRSDKFWGGNFEFHSRGKFEVKWQQPMVKQ